MKIKLHQLLVFLDKVKFPQLLLVGQDYLDKVLQLQLRRVDLAYSDRSLQCKEELWEAASLGQSQVANHCSAETQALLLHQPQLLEEFSVQWAAVNKHKEVAYLDHSNKCKASK